MSKWYKDPLYHFKNLREKCSVAKTKMGRVERSRCGLQRKARPLSLLPKLIEAINIMFIFLKQRLSVRKEKKCVRSEDEDESPCRPIPGTFGFNAALI